MPCFIVQWSADLGADDIGGISFMLFFTSVTYLMHVSQQAKCFLSHTPQSGHGFSCSPIAGASQCGESTGAQKAGDGSLECSQSIVSQSVSSREPLILLSTREYISPNDPSADTHIPCTSFWWWGSDSCGFWRWDALHLPSIQTQEVGSSFCPLIPPSSSSTSSVVFQPLSLFPSVISCRWIESISVSHSGVHI